jgi:hypothetical protein
MARQTKKKKKMNMVRTLFNGSFDAKEAAHNGRRSGFGLDDEDQEPDVLKVTSPFYVFLKDYHTRTALAHLTTYLLLIRIRFTTARERILSYRSSSMSCARLPTANTSMLSLWVHANLSASMTSSEKRHRPRIRTLPEENLLFMSTNSMMPVWKLRNPERLLSSDASSCIPLLSPRRLLDLDLEWVDWKMK